MLIVIVSSICANLLRLTFNLSEVSDNVLYFLFQNTFSYFYIIMRLRTLRVYVMFLISTQEILSTEKFIMHINEQCMHISI